MIVIAMSTYNGQMYIDRQIDSVLNQDVQDFKLLIRDDGSEDSTVERIKAYTDPRICLIEGSNIGITPSFCVLLQQAMTMGAEYVFFCDQDDIWYPDKLRRMLRAFSEDTACPQLVFSDFSTIDGAGNRVLDSYIRKAKIRLPKDGDYFPSLLAQPYVFGCVCGINRSLLSLVTEIPEGAEMYDCWIALTASLLGAVRYLPEATIAHRFHNSNATGQAGQASLHSRLHRLTDGFSRQCANTRMRLAQISLLERAYGNLLPAPSQERLARLHQANQRGRLALMRSMHKMKIARGGILQNCFFYLTVCMNREGFDL